MMTPKEQAEMLRQLLAAKGIPSEAPPPPPNPMPVNDAMAAGPAPPDPMGMAAELMRKRQALAPMGTEAGMLGQQGQGISAQDATLLQKLMGMFGR